MFEWKVEEMKLMNERKKVVGRSTAVYAFESTTSREDKIAFVDSIQDGKLSYILALIEKFNVDKENLPKDEYGSVKTVSLKTWIKRNDTKYGRRVIDDWYNYGQYKILGSERYIQDGGEHKGVFDYYEDLVGECFRRQLIWCEAQEKKYFEEHDEYSILKKEVEKKSSRYNTTFGVHIVFCSGGQLLIADDNDNNRDITLEELKELCAKYAQIDALVEKLTAETHIVY